MELRDKRYNNIKLIFEEREHKYTDTNKNEYISTTTILHTYKEKFDKKYWLRRKAKELNVSEKTLEKQWNDITKEACDRGNLTHNNLEDGIRISSMFKNAVKYMIKDNGEMITVADIPNINTNIKKLDIKEFIDVTENKYPKIYEVLQYYIDRDYTIYSEIGCFLVDYLLSGTIDVLCIRDDKFVIGDWKTNRGGLKFEAGYFKKDKSQIPNQETDVFVKTDKKLLPPLNNLPECNGSIYNLQLSIYAWMVEFILGIPNAGLWLCHIDSDFILNEYGMPKRYYNGYKLKPNPKEKVSFYKMNYLRNEVDLIMKDRLITVNAYNNKNKTLFD